MLQKGQSLNFGTSKPVSEGVSSVRRCLVIWSKEINADRNGVISDHKLTGSWYIVAFSVQKNLKCWYLKMLKPVKLSFCTVVSIWSVIVCA